ncbi:hypothetical protein SBV45_03860 [Chlamydia crocodili]|uniref:MotA/TolQ/ExbB proton channel domain-containing protein n=1 Tax=Chlamydia crocodili TaxID=2766982 RepID=A0ABX8CF87_9CHLA|nr:hypothetical protein [Chlamydia crocodili]QVE49109.1 hypothetical protein H9Q19_00050 [Chlamydia crocodili]
MKMYNTNAEFTEKTKNHPYLIRTAYSRTNEIIGAKEAWTHMVLSSLPILGTIRGLARLYSIYSVKDRSEDTTSALIVHTLVGIFETLGLGIVLMIIPISLIFLNIILAFIKTLFEFIRRGICNLKRLCLPNKVTTANKA